MQGQGELKPQEAVQAFIFLALAMAIAGSAVVAGKVMVLAMPVFIAAELGVATSLFFLLPFAYRQRRQQAALDIRTHLILALQALLGVVLYRICMFWGLQYTTATAGGLISSAAPALIGLLAFWLLREKLLPSRVVAISVVTLGIISVNLQPFLDDSTHAVDALKGNSLVLVAVFCEAAFSVASKAQCRPMTAL